MTEFIIKKLPYDLSSHAGLAFVGKYLKRINLNALVDPAFPVRSGCCGAVASYGSIEHISGLRRGQNHPPTATVATVSPTYSGRVTAGFRVIPMTTRLQAGPPTQLREIFRLAARGPSAGSARADPVSCCHHPLISPLPQAAADAFEDRKINPVLVARPADCRDLLPNRRYAARPAKNNAPVLGRLQCELHRCGANT